MLTSPSQDGEAAFTFGIRSRGVAIPDTVQVLSVEVRHELGLPSRASIRVVDGDSGENEFSISNMGIFDPGVPVSIEAGYGSKMSPVFAGTLIRQGISIKDALPLLILVCEGPVPGADVPQGKAQAAYAEPVLKLTYGWDIMEFRTGTEALGLVRFQGSALVAPGSSIRLQGLGKRHDCDAPVVGVSHDLQDGIWNTTVRFQPNPDSLYAPRPR